jgi:CRISPR-associated protein Cmr2
MPNHLLLVSLGPIQDFIATARRCHDLWYGSWLLSDLARTTAEAIAERCGAGAVIFPAGLASSADRPGVSNKILARVPDGVDPTSVAEHANQRQAARLRALRDEAWSLSPPAERVFDRASAERQVDELMEFLWVAVPEIPTYDAARKVAESRLASLKNTRRWTQPPWTTGAVPKSSLDGSRESVIDEAIYHRERGWTPEQRRQAFGAKSGERLCGIGLLKRRGVEVASNRPAAPRFHSTSHVAAVPVLSALDPKNAKTYLASLRSLGLDTDRFRIGPGGVDLAGHDGSLLFPTRLEEHFTESSERGSDARALADQARKHLHALLRSVGVAEPYPYYASLQADGDRMGVAIDTIDSIEGHIQLGLALNAFTLDCRRIVEAHGGSLLFAGGDDVLALLPLPTSVAASRALAERFAEVVAPVVRALAPECPPPTLSVGLGICHAREPMSDARLAAKEAEVLAKQTRNALGIVVDKRSGGKLTLSRPWGQPLDVTLDRWRSLLEAGAVSRKTAHDLEDLAEHLEGNADADERVALVKELLDRKRARGGGAAVQAHKDEILAALEGPGDGAAMLRALSHELQIASMLVAATVRAPALEGAA